MNAALVIAAAAAALFRVVPLACTGDRLAIAGGGVLRLADGVTCATVVPGRALTIAIGDDGRAAPQPVPLPSGATPKAAADIPRTAFVLAPAAEKDADQTTLVTVQILVTVPARTPPGDDIYVSTDRSNWSPSEVRMDRVDARNFRLTLQLHRGAQLAFRITRGSTATMERDASRALPPAHIAVGEPNARVEVNVPAWADID